MPLCQEKEYYLACACDEIYSPPSAYFSLFGLTVQASFLRGKMIFLTLFSLQISHTVNAVNLVSFLTASHTRVCIEMCMYISVCNST